MRGSEVVKGETCSYTGMLVDSSFCLGALGEWPASVHAGSYPLHMEDTRRKAYSPGTLTQASTVRVGQYALPCLELCVVCRGTRRFQGPGLGNLTHTRMGSVWA